MFLEIAAGVGIAALAAVMPNVSSIMVAAVASSINPIIGITAIVADLFLQTFKEIYSPQRSGDPMTGAIASGSLYYLRALKGEQLFNSVLNMKMMTAVVGLVIGMAVGILGIPLLSGGGLSILSLAVALAVIASVLKKELNQKEKNFANSIIYLSITSIWFMLSSSFGFGYPVLVLSLCLFFFPMAIKTIKNPPKKEVEEGTVDSPILDINSETILPVVLTAGAGVNFNTTNANLNGPVQAYFMNLCVGVLIEFIALGRIIVGANASGIAVVASEVAAANLGVVIFAGIAAYYLCLLISKHIKKIFEYDSVLNWVGIAVCSGATLAITGWYAIPLLALGFIVSPRLEKTSLPVKGLLFLGPLLI